MRLGYFEIYLIVINVLGFIMFAINTWLYTYTENGQIDAILTITSFIGGSLGIVLSIFLFDRKAQKGNMMSRVFVSCMLVIQVIVVMFFEGYHQEKLNFAIWDIFWKYRILLIYLILINVITFIVFGIDKHNAIQHRSRIRIITLLALAFIGGSIGGLLAMYVFRHKTRKDYFAVGIPLILIMQVVVIFYLANLGIV